MSRVLPYNAKQWEISALLDGRKTVTRRLVGEKVCIIRDDQEINKNFKGQFELYNITPRCGIPQNVFFKPPYQPGDILYVRETWFYESHMEDKTEGEPDLPNGRYSHRYTYRADNPDYPVNTGVGACGWHPSIHMPKEAARIWLKVTDVRVERLQEINGQDVLKEGLNSLVHPKAFYFDMNQREMFEKLWNSIIKKSDLDRYGWEANPWVWVIEFERCEKPEDEDQEEREINRDGLCEDGEVTEGELLLVNICKTADEDEKQALYRYERYIHRYDKKWLDEHGIENTLAE